MWRNLNGVKSNTSEKLKQYLNQMMLLTTPSPKSELLLYVAATQGEVSATLIQERLKEGWAVQIPVYFVSEALSGAKLHYSELEKIFYEVFMTSRKLRHYFQDHNIKVMMNQPWTVLQGSPSKNHEVGHWIVRICSRLPMEIGNKITSSGGLRSQLDKKS